MLAESLNESDMAAVVTTSGVNSGLTRDRAALLSAVMKVSAHPNLPTVMPAPTSTYTRQT